MSNVQQKDMPLTDYKLQNNEIRNSLILWTASCTLTLIQGEKTHTHTHKKKTGKKNPRTIMIWGLFLPHSTIFERDG